MRAPRLHDRYPDYAPEPTPVVPKWDPLRYDRLPEDDPGVEHVLRGDDTTFQHWATPEALWYLVTFSLGAFVLTQGARLVGDFLLLPVLVPLWVVATLFVPLRDYLRYADRRRAVLLFVAMPIAFAALLFATTAAGDGVGRLACLFVALLATGVLVDQLGAHAVGVLLARAVMPRGQKDRWRALWARRFDGRTLAVEAAALHAAAAAAGEGSRYAADTALLDALRWYQWGFAPLLVVWVLSLIPHALPLLLVLPPSLALLWVAWLGPPGGIMAAGRLLAAAAESWLRYGARAAGAPGVFVSPGGDRLARLVLTAASLGLGAAALAPMTPYLRALPWLIQGDTLAVFWALLLDALAGWLVPVVVLGSTAFAVLGGVLAAGAALDAHLPAEESEERRWDAIVETLRTSENPRARRQLFLGYHAVADYPIFLPLTALREHVLLSGATTATTTRGMLPLLAQLLRVGTEPRDRAFRGPLLVIDLKGEGTPFHAVRAEAARNGRPFKFFSNVAGLTTHAFNPLLDLQRAGLTRVQIGETLRAAFHLEHGTAWYRRGHFAAASRAFLADLLIRVRDLDSLATLYRESQRPRVRTPAEKEQEREASELLSTLKLLAARPELNVTATQPIRPAVFAERIDMVAAMAEDAVLYFHLQATSEEALVRYIASLVLECFHAAVAHTNLTRSTAEQKLAYVFLDEVQTVTGRNVGLFMEHARASGLALILTNRAPEDLPDDVRGALEHNTAYRQYFTFRSPEALRYMQALAGTTEEIHVRDPDADLDVPSFTPRLSVNDLTAISADDALSVMIQATSRDYSQFEGRPIVLRSPRHLTDAARAALDASPWPAGDATIPVAAETDPAAGTRPSPRATPPPGAGAGADVVRRLDRITMTDDGYAVPPG